MIITPSEYLKKYIKKNIKSENIKIINNFSNFKIKTNDFIEKELNHPGNLNFITLSRLVKWKNIDALIDAFSDLKEFNLNIYGTGPELNSIQNKIKKFSSTNIFLHGEINRSKIYHLLLNSDCFIQISSYEGMSFSILEALALNKPMLLSNIEPNFETAKNAAIYVNQNSISSIKESLKLFKSAKIRKTISDNAKDIVSKLYNKDNILDEYYNEL